MIKNKNNNINSPGHGPIGVLDPVQGCLGMFPDRAKWAAQGPWRPKSVRSCCGNLPPISLRAMATWYLRGILSTQSESIIKMQGFEPSIDLDFENGFFEKGIQLNNYFLGTFLPSSMRSRDTVKMQGFELAATLVPPSDFQSFFWGPRRAPGDPPGKAKRSVLSPSLCARLAE